MLRSIQLLRVSRALWSSSASSRHSWAMSSRRVSWTPVTKNSCPLDSDRPSQLWSPFTSTLRRSYRNYREILKINTFLQPNSQTPSLAAKGSPSSPWVYGCYQAGQTASLTGDTEGHSLSLALLGMTRRRLNCSRVNRSNGRGLFLQSELVYGWNIHSGRRASVKHFIQTLKSTLYSIR